MTGGSEPVSEGNTTKMAAIEDGKNSRCRASAEQRMTHRKHRCLVHHKRTESQTGRLHSGEDSKISPPYMEVGLVLTVEFKSHDLIT